eukprot:TRINITY_DN336_c0_g1_i1.p1 TRINITY_DN336_c0_g1~~TRINITY_DN336_c0_g1_i1.p1  ORF type:complete len:970 (-),score=247.28 TRINITY_DN336_c0_g1_i1:495-3233(-)
MDVKTDDDDATPKSHSNLTELKTEERISSAIDMKDDDSTPLSDLNCMELRTIDQTNESGSEPTMHPINGQIADDLHTSFTITANGTELEFNETSDGVIDEENELSSDLGLEDEDMTDEVAIQGDELPIQNENVLPINGNGVAPQDGHGQLNQRDFSFDDGILSNNNNVVETEMEDDVDNLDNNMTRNNRIDVDTDSVKDIGNMQQSNHLDEIVFGGNVAEIRALLRGSVPEFREQLSCFIKALVRACCDGNLEIVDVLLEGSRMEFREINVDNATPLWYACEHGHVDIVKSLLEDTDESFRTKGYEQATPLFAAVKSGHIEVARLLLEGTSPEYRQIVDFGGSIALCYACNEGNLEMVKVFIEDMDSEDISDIKAFHLAVKKRHHDIVALFLDVKDPSYREIISTDGQTSLVMAFDNNDLEMSELLLRNSRPEFRKIGFSDGRPISSRLFAEEPSEELIKLMMADGEDFISSEERYTRLMDAVAKEESPAKIRQLLDSNDEKYREIQNNHGETALFMASREGYTEIVKVLLYDSKEHYREIANTLGQTPIWIACKYGNFEVVKELLRNTHASRYLHICCGKNYTPLLAACMSGEHGEHPEIVQLLLDSTPFEYREIRSDNDLSPLAATVYCGRIASMKLLLENSPSKYRKVSFFGEPVLTYAYKLDHIEMMKVLLDGSAVEFREVRNSDGDTALMKACEDGNVLMAETLLKGSRPYYRKMLRDDDDESTLLMTAIKGRLNAESEFYDYTSIIAMLLYGMETDYREATNNNGWTPLMLACRHGFTEIVRLLLRGCRPQYRIMDTEQDGSPLWIAAACGHVRVVRLLMEGMAEDWLEKGKRTGFVNSTPLSAAVWGNHLEVARILLEETSPSYRRIADADGVTPLILASIRGNASMVELLLKDCPAGYKEHISG